MKARIIIFSTIIYVLGGITAPIGVLANEPILADVEVSPDKISFNPYFLDEEHILRVSCDSGEYFQQRFEAGESPSFQAVDMKGHALSDGNCNYELRPIPATEELDSPDEPAYVQFGSMKISQGTISERADSGTHQRN